MPEGYDVAYPKDSTEFIKISVEDVIQTLFEAIILVVVVMYLFLQNIRATLIPALAVPVVLLGTFGVLALFGYSINTLTLFAMVLAIGLWWMTPSWWWKTSSVLCATKGCPPGKRPKIDGRNFRRADRHCAGALCGIPADGLLRRLYRGHLPPVLGHHYFGDVPLRGGGADPDARAVRLDPESHRSAQRASSARLTASTVRPSTAIRTRCCAPCAVPVACW